MFVTALNYASKLKWIQYFSKSNIYSFVAVLEKRTHLIDIKLKPDLQTRTGDLRNKIWPTGEFDLIAKKRFKELELEDLLKEIKIFGKTDIS